MASLKDLAGSVTPILAVVSTALTIFITYTANQIDQTTKKTDAQLKQAELALRVSAEDRTARQAEHDFSLKIYEKVYVALETSDSRKHAVALALVDSLEDERPIKKYLLVLFRQKVVEPSIQEQAAESVFRIDQKVVARDTARQDDSRQVNYDVFWCEGKPEREQLASQAAERIRAQRPTSRVRVRVLPEKVNLERRFNVHANVIRVDAGEEALGRELKTWIDPVLAPQTFSLDGNPQATPKYLSAFVCRS
jgi:hypothetical protein